MRSANPTKGWSVRQGGLRQRGQALVYGLFVLAGGLTALFFLFNTGQLTLEKDKLTTTADAVAYSGGVMRARALNFTAYTNRALVANEVAVAQMVSIASWTHYVKQSSVKAAGLGCATIYNWPAGKSFLGYAPLCMGLYYASSYITSISNWLDTGAPVMVGLIQGAKDLLVASQATMMADLLLQSRTLLKEVADANFRGNGAVYVDPRPLEDDFFWFDGGPFLNFHGGSDRSRFASVATAAANRDGFVPNRSWTDKQAIPHFCGRPPHTEKDRIDRSGGTALIGLNEWRGNDAVAYTEYYTHVKLSWHGISISCRSRTSTWATGTQSAGGRASSTNWSAYRGLPTYLDMSNRALTYTPENADPKKRDPRLRFSVMLTRRVDQTATSEGRSNIKPAPGGGAYGINQFKNKAAKSEYASVATAEVFFQRPTGRADGRKELANMFNPYWQAHLVETSNPVLTTARLYQGVVF